MFIVIEGIDACGKSTQVEILQQRLNAHALSFPRYNTPVGQLILQHLKKEIVLRDEALAASPGNDLMFQCLMVADKYDAANEIKSILVSGQHVVTSRWTQSAIVYGTSDGLPMDWTLRVQSALPSPDLNILLDLSVEAAIARRQQARDRYEADKSKISEIRQRYLDLWTKRQEDPFGDWVVLDGAAPVEDVTAAIVQLVKQRDLGRPPFSGEHG